MSENNSTAPDVMTTKQLQQYLSIGKCRALEILQSGEIPFIKLGRGYRVFKKDVDKWLEDKKQVGNQAIEEVTIKKNIRQKRKAG